MWIKLHDALPDHPKVLASSAALHIDKDLLVGKLTRLWLWAATGRENGFIADYEAETVAEVMRWRKDPQALLDALCIVPPHYASGLLERAEGGYRIHDWEEQVAELIDKRDARKEQTRQRVQRYRERKVTQGVTQDVTRYEALQSNAPVTHCNAPRVDKSRVTKSNEDTEDTPYSPPSGADAPDPDPEPPKSPSQADRRFEEFWGVYPRRVGKLAARKAWDKVKVNADLHARMLAAIDRAKRSDQWTRDGGQYIPHPATWLNQGRWEDELPPGGTRAAPPGKSSKWDPFSIPNDPDRYKPRDDDFSAAAERMMHGE